MRNKHILDKIKATPITEYVNNYRQNWLQHVERMDRASIPKQTFRFVPIGRRLPGRPKRRWMETEQIIGMEGDDDYFKFFFNNSIFT
jgi:hypothetical protein